MKYLLVLLTFGIAAAVNSYIPGGCPVVDDPSQPLHIPHATECNVFWKCLNGIPNLVECQPGLHWSIENNWCDYPENAKCIRPLPEESEEENGNGEEEEEEIEYVKECPEVEDPTIPTHLPHTTDCTKFWKCLHGVPNLIDCPTGQHWSIENSWCDYPENAKCVRPLV